MGESMHVHVQLESADLPGRVFLANHEIEIEDGVVQPLEYQGKTFHFLHKTQIGDYSGTSTESFVFVRATAT